MRNGVRNRRNAWAGALLAMAAAQAAHAENLMDIFRLAIERDPQLLAAQAEHDAQLLSKPLALGAMLPRVSVTGNYGRSNKDYTATPYIASVYTSGTYVPLGHEVTIDYSGLGMTYDHYTLTLQLYQPIFDMGLISDYRKAGHTVLRAELDYRLAQQDMILRVAERYFNVLLNGGVLNLARAEKNAVGTQLEVAKKKYSVGLIAIADVHELQARFDHAIAQEVTAENSLAAAREDLRETTGVLHNSLLVLKPEAPMIPPSPANIDTWTGAAIAQNLRVRVSEHHLQSAQMDVNRERSAFLPNVGLIASYGRAQSGDTLYGFSQKESIIALDVSMNLFQGGSSYTKISQAQLRVEKAGQELEQARREASKQTRNAFLGVLAGISHVAALRQAVNTSESAYKSTVAGFEVGTRSSFEVMTSQQELFRSQREYAAARIEYILNSLRLKYYVGQLTIDDLEQLNAWLG